MYHTVAVGVILGQQTLIGFLGNIDAEFVLQFGGGDGPAIVCVEVVEGQVEVFL